jgi:hypothetical protein
MEAGEKEKVFQQCWVLTWILVHIVVPISHSIEQDARILCGFLLETIRETKNPD